MKGIPNGVGTLKTSDGFGYEGNFEDGKKCGPGRFYILDGSYSLEGEFVNDEAKL